MSAASISRGGTSLLTGRVRTEMRDGFPLRRRITSRHSCEYSLIDMRSDIRY
jgi:hypothetical protein